MGGVLSSSSKVDPDPKESARLSSAQLAPIPLTLANVRAHSKKKLTLIAAESPTVKEVSPISVPTVQDTARYDDEKTRWHHCSYCDLKFSTLDALTVHKVKLFIYLED